MLKVMAFTARIGHGDDGSALFVKLAFSAAKKYPRECKTARIDIDRRMTRVICDWRDKK